MPKIYVYLAKFYGKWQKSMLFGKKYREMPERHAQTTTISIGARSTHHKQFYLAYRKTHHIMHVVHGLYCHMYLKCYFYL